MQNPTNPQTWTEQEDQTLKSLTQHIAPKTNWLEISCKMKKRGFLKTSSQCQKRHKTYIAPELKKQEWNKAQNKKLFELHSKFGNAWKDIASYFYKKTDNSIKNQFFSLIRKSLRNARKILGLMSNTECINKMKPRALTDFIKRKVFVEYPEKFFKVCGKKNENISVLSFIQKYSYGQFFEIFSDTTEVDLFVIEKVIGFLDDLNFNYNEKRNKKIEKKNKKKLDLLKISRNRVYHLKKKNNGVLNYINEEGLDLTNEYIILKDKRKDLNEYCDDFFNQKSQISKNEMNCVLTELTELSFKMGDLLTITNKKDFEKIITKEKKKFMKMNLMAKAKKINNSNVKDCVIQIESEISNENISVKSCEKVNSFLSKKKTSFDEKNFENNHKNESEYNFNNSKNYKKTSFELGNKFFKNIDRNKKHLEMIKNSEENNFQNQFSKQSEYLKAKESFKNLRRNSEKINFSESQKISENNMKNIFENNINISENNIDVNRLTTFKNNSLKKYGEKCTKINQGGKNLSFSKSGFVKEIDYILVQSPLTPKKQHFPGIIISKPKFTNDAQEILKKFK